MYEVKATCPNLASNQQDIPENGRKMCVVHFSIWGRGLLTGNESTTALTVDRAEQSGAKSQLDLEPLVRHYGHSILARIVASSILAVEVTLLNERRERSSFQRGYQLKH